ncbi:hypothetical protein HY989_01685 [Candidatus Micrarchaeota archaeon]|nr:hypothetical protein [Candidatus Micrarchaeota archaeon]
MKKLLVNDSTMHALQKKMDPLAKAIIDAARDDYSFAIRYHNDCDGVCAALNIYKAIKAVFPQTPIQSLPSDSPVYYVEKAMQELSEIGVPSETFAIIVDHATGPESMDALKLLKGSGVTIAVLDHHPNDPRVEKIADYFISPLSEGGSSSHCAGLLCYELARLIDEESADENLAYFAMQSDKSSFGNHAKEYKEAVALDYATHYRELNLPFYERFLSSKEMVAESYLQAKEKIENAMKLSEKYTEVRDFGAYFVVISKVSKFLKKKEYPPRGKVMNEIIAKKERDIAKPIVCLGVTEDGISFRATSEILKMGFDANLLIQELKKTFPAEILNGGGHAVAASLLATPESLPLIVAQTLELIGKQIRN